MRGVGIFILPLFPGERWPQLQTALVVRTAEDTNMMGTERLETMLTILYYRGWSSSQSLMYA